MYLFSPGSQALVASGNFQNKAGANRIKKENGLELLRVKAEPLAPQLLSMVLGTQQCFLAILCSIV